MLRILLLTILLTAATTAHAEEALYNRVDFSTEAAREITNDLLLAQMSLEVSDQSPARVAQLLNTTINENLKKAAAFPTVKVSSGNQSTYPLYGKNNHLDGWRGNARIRLESRDFKAAGELIGQLQTSLQLTGVSFSVAPETRRKLEDELVGEGLAVFRKRAEAISEALGGSGYRIVHITINHGGIPPQPLMLDGAVMAIKATAPAPEFVGGDSEITAQISGTVEIVLPESVQ